MIFVQNYPTCGYTVPTYYRNPIWLSQPFRLPAPCYEENETATEDPKRDETKVQESSPPLIYHRRNVKAFEDESHYTLSLDLPGVKSTDLKVDVLDKGAILVKAERTSGKATKMFHQFTFDRTRVDKNNIQANLVDGVLTITIPKKEEVKPEPFDVTVKVGYAPDSEETDDAKEDQSPSKKLITWTFDLPGVKVQDIKVELNGDQLSLQAERRQGGTVVAKTDRSFTIDPMMVETAKLVAFLADGVLTLVAEEKEPVPPLSIAIGTPADDSPEPQKQEIEAEVEVNPETVVEDEED